MIQQKKCKGQNKARGYEGCGNMTDQKLRKFGLCPLCLWDWMKTTELGKIYYQKQFLPNSNRIGRKREKQETKKRKEENKTISQLIQEARKPFQKWIRMRDANLGCISCGTTTSEIWDAGHYYKAEIYTGLIFDERNVHKQCRKCNTYLGGNELKYMYGLVERYGSEWVEKLNKESNQHRNKKFTREELKEIKSKYQKLLRSK